MSREKSVDTRCPSVGSWGNRNAVPNHGSEPYDLHKGLQEMKGKGVPAEQVRRAGAGRKQRIIFRRNINFKGNNFPYTFMGLELIKVSLVSRPKNAGARVGGRRPRK